MKRRPTWERWQTTFGDRTADFFDRVYFQAKRYGAVGRMEVQAFEVRLHRAASSGVRRSIGSGSFSIPSASLNLPKKQQSVMRKVNSTILIELR